jgi:peroxiredoxin
MDPHGLLNEWLRTMFPAGLAPYAERTVPSFLLPDSEGWLISSEEMCAQGPYVLAFFHGSWCSSCVERLEYFETCLDRIHALGADLVACSPETFGHPRKLKAEKRLRYHILSDVDCALSADLGWAFAVPEEMRLHLRHSGIDLAVRNGDQRWLLPAPMTMVVDRTGLAVKTNIEIEKRADLEDVIRILSSLQ